MNSHQEAERNHQEAVEARRALQAATFRDEAAIGRAISREFIARENLAKYARATAAEGFRFIAR